VTASRRALVVGATGIAGQNLGTRLVAAGWDVWGLSRSSRPAGPGVRPVRADLADPAGFTATRDTRAGFFSYVEQCRAAKILP
jgi:nucleoside-diphosphate-sugar epimerase